MEVWILTLLIIIIIYVVLITVEQRKYFKKYGIPKPFEVPLLGHFGVNFFTKKHFSTVMEELYYLKKDAKYVGCFAFLKPVIVTLDPELVKMVCVKNFESFADHKTFVDPTVDPLFGKNLFFLNGDKWREVRSILSPSFTSSKMRSMFVLMSQCAENFVNQLVALYSEQPIDMKDIFPRYANDVIASCAFGISVDSIKDPKNDFYLHGKSSTTPTFTNMIKFAVMSLFPNFGRTVGIRVISKEDTAFFINVIKTTIEERDAKGINRPDMLQLMMNAREKGNELDLLEMAAQAFIFFLAGFETVSNQLCMISHELATHPEIQKKLQAEIDHVMEESKGQPSYDSINSLAYLDAVFSETLRLHPLPFISRLCSQDFELPPALPDSKPYVVKSGTEVFVPVSSIHKDSKYFENPDKFDPTRFIDKKSTTADVTNLGFGLGPRMCIGNRFAILESKVVIFHLLHKCNLMTCEKTCLPLVYDKKSFTPIPKGGAWLKIQRRSQ